MRPELAHLTDRELLELIYLMLILVYDKIHNDSEALALNVLADLIGTKITNGTRYGTTSQRL